MQNELVERLMKQSGLHEFLEQELPAQWHWDELNALLPKFAALIAEECAADLERIATQAGVTTIWPLIAKEFRAKFPMPKDGK